MLMQNTQETRQNTHCTGVKKKTTTKIPNDKKQIKILASITQVEVMR